jgi:hypothetical protein
MFVIFVSYVFGIFYPVLVSIIKKNLATLGKSPFRLTWLRKLCMAVTALWLSSKHASLKMEEMKTEYLSTMARRFRQPNVGKRGHFFC